MFFFIFKYLINAFDINTGSVFSGAFWWATTCRPTARPLSPTPPPPTSRNGRFPINLRADVKQIRPWLESTALVGYRPSGGNWKILMQEISSFAKRRRSGS